MACAPGYRAVGSVLTLSDPFKLSFTPEKCIRAIHSLIPFSCPPSRRLLCLQRYFPHDVVRFLFDHEVASFA